MLCLWLAACGGGGGGGTSPVGPQPPGGPGAGVVFPPDSSITDESVLTLRGVTTGPGTAVAVSIGGFAATSSDGFATWRADVPLQLGDNTLAVQTTSSEGLVNGTAATVRVTRAPALVRPAGVALDPAAGRLFVSDLGALDAAGLPTGFGVQVAPVAGGARTVLSGPGTGGGSGIAQPTRLDYDATNLRLFASDAGLVLMLAIDPTTGVRSQLQLAGGVGVPGAVRAVPQQTTVPVQQRFAWIDTSFDTVRRGAETTPLFAVTGPVSDFVWPDGMPLFALQPRRGELRADFATAVTGTTVGTGPQLLRPRAVAFDAPRDRFIVVDAGHRAVLAVERGTGDRTILSGPAFGTGQQLADPQSVVLSANGAVAYVADRGRGAVLAVDLFAGTRTIAAGEARGTGPGLPGALGGDRLGSRLFYVGDTGTADAAVVGVDFASGARTAVGSNLGAGGPRLEQVTSMCADPFRASLLIAQRGSIANPGDMTADLSVPLIGGVLVQQFTATAVRCDGVRLQLSALGAGAGDLLVELLDAADTVLASRTVFDVVPGDVVRADWPAVATTPTQQYRVRVTGNGLRHELAANGNHSLGTLTQDGFDLGAVNLAMDVLFADAQVLRVDPITGARTLLSGQTSGVTPALPMRLCFDVVGNRVLGIGIGSTELYLIEPGSGSRDVVALPAPAIAVAAAGGHALVLAGSPLQLLDVEIDAGTGTGIPTVISGFGVGAGPVLDGDAVAMVHDPLAGRTFVGYRGRGEVVVVDHASGNRTALGLGGHRDAVSLYFDSSTRRLYCGDDTARCVQAIDLDTASRVLHSR